MTTPDGTAVTLYDTTLRDGTQGENITLSLADKLRVARMLDEYGFPFIEGGWPGSNPKDIEFFAAARKERWQHAKLAAFGCTRHRANRPEDDPNLRELVAAETPVVTIFGKSWLLHVIEVLGATPAENLDMIADSVAFVADRGREAVYDAEHFFDGYRADRDYALSTLRAARQAGARTLVLCDTNGGTLTGELVEIVGDVRTLARGRRRTRPPSPGASTPTTTPSWRSPTRSPPSRPASATSRRPSTATASAAATRTWSRSSPTSRSRRRTTLVPAGGGDLAALTAAQPRRSPRSPTRCPTTTSRTSAGRRSRTRAASTAPPSPRSSGATSTSTPARSATPAGWWSPSWAAGPTPRSARASWATSSRASSTRASSRS